MRVLEKKLSSFFKKRFFFFSIICLQWQFFEQIIPTETETRILKAHNFLRVQLYVADVYSLEKMKLSKPSKRLQKLHN